MTSDLRFAGRTIFEEEHEAFRALVRDFIDRVRPEYERWEEQHRIDRSFFVEAGALGLLMFPVEERHGGQGIDDFRFNAVVDEEFARANLGAAGLTIALQNDVLAPYFVELTDEAQKERWLPGMVAGETIAAIGMTEPGTGSDLAGIRTAARRDGGDWLISGSKTFISSGQNADLVIVVARTSEDRHRGLSLFVVESGMPGFERGRNLQKLGMHPQDTSELHFDAVRVPQENLLGEEGQGFFALMRNLPQERMSLAVTAIGASVGMLEETLDHVTTREAFGQPIGSFQNTRFRFAELAAEVEIGRTFVDDCVRLLIDGSLSPARAAKAKYWATELQQRVAHRCLQMFGGYGYMREYGISRAYADARIQSIYGGTNEIMREIIGKDLGL
ncbi:acyl-CoA dehydrogenase family protein [Microbacterium sp. No. 7]|uniref:acyl-CoA dehydrogenase family protein n=1 Tax=Microbacterium sp. No. 7 TaxID=1714373 RepID=UPI0006D19AAF|nr:acyl-CoA dehydrogenase family protein [Microbacterium sp. No. 7]ALJ21841.1 acyl-CoA dehydrogenase [Microbacterium sp. No. 7]